MSIYPEHDKLHKVSDTSQQIGEFLDWYASKGYQRMRWDKATDQRPCSDWHCIEGFKNGDPDQPCPNCEGQGHVIVEFETWVSDRRSTTEILAEYFEIDLNVLEQEKRSMLDTVRAAQRPEG